MERNRAELAEMKIAMERQSMRAELESRNIEKRELIAALDNERRDHRAAEAMAKLQFECERRDRQVAEAMERLQWKTERRQLLNKIKQLEQKCSPQQREEDQKTIAKVQAQIERHQLQHQVYAMDQGGIQAQLENMRHYRYPDVLAQDYFHAPSPTVSIHQPLLNNMHRIQQREAEERAFKIGYKAAVQRQLQAELEATQVHEVQARETHLAVHSITAKAEAAQPAPASVTRGILATHH
jgi:hypothetical protein